jgi:hypothetical protein
VVAPTVRKADVVRVVAQQGLLFVERELDGDRRFVFDVDDNFAVQPEIDATVMRSFDESLRLADLLNPLAGWHIRFVHEVLGGICLARCESFLFGETLMDMSDSFGLSFASPLLPQHLLQGVIGFGSFAAAFGPGSTARLDQLPEREAVGVGSRRG